MNTALGQSIAPAPVRFLVQKAQLFGIHQLPQEDIPSVGGYRFDGVSLNTLIDGVNSFGKRFAVCSESNKIWGNDSRVQHMPTRGSPTLYPLHPEEFKRHFVSLSTRSYEDQRRICAEDGGEVTSVEEFFDFLIDYLLCSSARGMSPLKLINELISPSMTPGEQRTFCVIRCRNMLYPKNPRWSLCVKLHRDAGVSIFDWMLASASADVGSLCVRHTH